GCAGARLRLHRLRQRRAGDLSPLARSADDGPLGSRRPGRRRRHARRAGARLQSGPARARRAHQALHEPAARVAGQDGAAGAPPRHRPRHQRRQGREPLTAEASASATLRRSRESLKSMSFVAVRQESGIATVVLSRGKVNALNPAVVEELSAAFEALRGDTAARAVILTGSGRFFSFGFDIPEFLSYTREEFACFLTRLTTLYRTLFSYPKPLVAALNGHAVAGGCMLALAADTAIVAEGNAKVALNEIGFGSSVFAGSTEMLQFRTGARASEIVYSGAMYAPAEAQRLGLVSEVVPPDALL